MLGCPFMFLEHQDKILGCIPPAVVGRSFFFFFLCTAAFLVAVSELTHRPDDGGSKDL
jgi:hypothetical protein